MSGCLGPQSPRNRGSCSHYSIPSPLIHLKAIPPSPFFFLLQASVFFPQELSASPHYASYFSHLIQPIPALCHLFHFSSLPLQDHITTLAAARALLYYSALPQGPALWLLCFFWLLPYLLSLHHPGLYLLLTKHLSNHFGQCLEFIWGHPASPISREKNPHSAFPSPLWYAPFRSINICSSTSLTKTTHSNILPKLKQPAQCRKPVLNRV